MARKKTIDDFYNDLLEHQQADKLQFELLHAKLDSMPTKDDLVSINETLNLLPSKEDLRNVNAGIGFFKVSWKFLLFIGIVATAITNWKLLLAFIGFSKM